MEIRNQSTVEQLSPRAQDDWFLYNANNCVKSGIILAYEQQRTRENLDSATVQHGVIEADRATLMEQIKYK